MHKIGHVAQTLNVSLRTIRYYEELGLIRPFRTEKGTRLYSEEDIARLHTALTLREHGLSLEQIAELATSREHFKTGKESSQKILSTGSEKIRLKSGRFDCHCFSVMNPLTYWLWLFSR